MGFASTFPDIVTTAEPLAPYTFLKLGGPAEFLAHPRDVTELSAIVRYCSQQHLPLRVLGGGCHLLVGDEGVRGVVVRLTAPAFTSVQINGPIVRVGAGVPLAALISQVARHRLAGLETLIGLHSSVGGAIRNNVGDRHHTIGRLVTAVEVITADGQTDTLPREELQFTDHGSNITAPVIVAVECKLDTDTEDAIVKRMRKAWIQRKAQQPFTFQNAGRMFRNPKGLSAATLIEQAGQARTVVGGVEVSERNANYLVTHPQATARDALRLLDLLQAKVRDHSGIALEREMIVW
jgi:UDP-N-acetylmuramate dehydrogenase